MRKIKIKENVDNWLDERDLFRIRFISSTT
jgi:hypothetical protein